MRQPGRATNTFGKVRGGKVRGVRVRAYARIYVKYNDSYNRY